MKEFGYVKSILTGAELQAGNMVSKVTLPPSYKLSMSSIKDQGNKPICVSVALTDIVQWHLKLDNIKANFKDSIFFDNDFNSSKNGMQPRNAFDILINKKLTDIPKSFDTYAMVTSVEVAKRCIVQFGPIMIALKAKSMNDVFWKGNQNLGGHAVLLTGYNQKGFILRNSWGTSYGDSGYIEFPYSDFDLVLESWTLIK